MKAIVLKRYRDKHTLVLFHRGDEIEVTLPRLEEINSTLAGTLVEEIKLTVKKKTVKK